MEEPRQRKKRRSGSRGEKRGWGKEKKRRRKGKRKERRSGEVGSSILLTRLKIIISLFFKRSPSIKNKCFDNNMEV